MPRRIVLSLAVAIAALLLGLVLAFLSLREHPAAAAGTPAAGGAHLPRAAGRKSPPR